MPAMARQLLAPPNEVKRSLGAVRRNSMSRILSGMGAKGQEYKYLEKYAPYSRLGLCLGKTYGVS
jgi:hypothetical protein